MWKREANKQRIVYDFYLKSSRILRVFRRRPDFSPSLIHILCNNCHKNVTHFLLNLLDIHKLIPKKCNFKLIGIFLNSCEIAFMWTQFLEHLKYLGLFFEWEQLISSRIYDVYWSFKIFSWLNFASGFLDFDNWITQNCYICSNKKVHTGNFKGITQSKQDINADLLAWRIFEEFSTNAKIKLKRDCQVVTPTKNIWKI